MPKNRSICKESALNQINVKLRGCKVAEGLNEHFVKKTQSFTCSTIRTSSEKNKTKRIQRMLRTMMRDSRYAPFLPLQSLQ